MDIMKDDGGTIVGFEGEGIDGLFGITAFKQAKLYKYTGVNDAGDVRLADKEGTEYLVTDVDGKNETVKEYAGCHLLAACCDGFGKLTPKKIAAVLESKGFKAENYLTNGNKAVWVLPETRINDAMTALGEII